jgi:hypothetical protein
MLFKVLGALSERRPSMTPVLFDTDLLGLSLFDIAFENVLLFFSSLSASDVRAEPIRKLTKSGS